MLHTANQYHNDKNFKLRISNQEAPTVEGQGVQTAQIAWFWMKRPVQKNVIHSLEIKTDPLAFCLSGILDVTDRWVITVSQRLQAVETKSGFVKEEEEVKLKE